MPRNGRTPLVLVRKENGGARTPSTWASTPPRYPLVAVVDADSILDPDALLVVAKPFADDPRRVVATGGVIRAVNGCRVVAGRVVDVADAARAAGPDPGGRVPARVPDRPDRLVPRSAR